VDCRVRRLAAYFGLADEDEDRSDGLHLEHLRPSLIEAARGPFVLAVVSSAMVLVVFDWSVAEAAGGAAIGAAIWGAFYFFDIRGRVPRGTLREPPPGAIVTRPASRHVRRWLAAVPLCLGLAWLADRWGLGAVFVPGQFFGIAAANVTGAALVARWERAHGARALGAAHPARSGDLYASARFGES
jgi:hypothetical protein